MRVLLRLPGRILPPTDPRATGPFARGARSRASSVKVTIHPAESSTATTGVFVGGVMELVAGVVPCFLPRKAGAISAGLVSSSSTAADEAKAGDARDGSVAMGGDDTGASCSSGGTSSERSRRIFCRRACALATEVLGEPCTSSGAGACCARAVTASDADSEQGTRESSLRTRISFSSLRRQISCMRPLRSCMRHLRSPLIPFCLLYTSPSPRD